MKKETVVRKSAIKRKLGRNEPVLLPFLDFADGQLWEMTALLGFDGIWLDLEHLGRNIEAAWDLIRAARAGGAEVMGRPAKGEFMQMGRLLEAGAQGIMYPRCDDAAEAAEVVKWAKFPPEGRRGCATTGADAPYCLTPVDRYIRAANEETFIVIQLEEQHAIENAAEIAAVAGVDVLFLGPGDYTVSKGIPGQLDHPLVAEAFRRIARAAKGAGKHWGTFASTAEMVKRLVEMGARFICYGEDMEILQAGFRKIQEEMSALGFTFRRPLEEQGGVL